MAKNFTGHELDQPLDQYEAESLIGAIRSFGDLREGNLYKGSTRGGYAHGGFIEHGVQKDVVAFAELLKTDFMR